MKPHFVKEYNIDLSDLLVPSLDGYHTFNKFFYRKLKPGARVPHEPENPGRIISPADCRSVVYPVTDASTYWIKVTSRFPIR